MVLYVAVFFLLCAAFQRCAWLMVSLSSDRSFRGQAMVGSGEDDPDVKALTIALVNGRIVDATIR